MKITIFGAAGEVGSRIVAEALRRGHVVNAVVRNPAQFYKLPSGVIRSSGDAGSSADVARLSEGQDLVISAVRPRKGEEEMLVPITESILNGVAQSGVRVLVVGGAASLMMPGSTDATVLTEPGFLPEDVVDIARACFAQHQMCSAHHEADWAYLSPPAILTPGERTGTYRLGLEELMVDNNGVSQISMEDFAVVLLDEAEHPRHHRVRFTAAY